MESQVGRYEFGHNHHDAAAGSRLPISTYAPVRFVNELNRLNRQKNRQITPTRRFDAASRLRHQVWHLRWCERPRADHADATLRAAVLIYRLVDERFGAELRVGIGINTGVVIARTIGGAGKLEFTLIGDTLNVAARVEQLTKTTGDAILLTKQCVDSLATRPPGLSDRGFHVLKGKSAALQVFSLD